MIRVAFLTLILLVAYYGCAALRLLPKNEMMPLEQIGVLKATEYLERKKVPVIVTTGTSKSAHLNSSFFHADTENLSVRGGVTLTGLHIIDRCKFVPHIILVEINRLSVRTFAEPKVVKYLEKNEHPLIRLMTDCRNRPIPLLVKRASEFLYSNTDRAAENVADAQQKAQADVAKTWLKQIGPKNANEGLSKNDKYWLNLTCARIKRLIARQQRKGSIVVLFDVPMDPAAQNIRIEVETNEYLRKKFPPDKYVWIDPSKESFKTVDLVHLTPEDSQRYAAYIEGQLLKKGYLVRETNDTLVAGKKSNAI